MEFLINIDVDDLSRAVDFYRNAFGLRPGRSFGAAGMEMLGGNAPLYLLAKEPGSQAAEGQWRNYRAPLDTGTLRYGGGRRGNRC